MKLNLEITNRCNSRCLNCNIWKSQEHQYLSVIDIKKILDSGLQIESIGLTGGEPFLNPEIIQIIDLIGNYNIRMNLTTNAIMPDYYLLNKLKNVSTLSLNELAIFVSIDGIGSVHDKLRGIHNNYISALKFLGSISRFKRLRYIGVSTTITKENCKQLYSICKIATSIKAVWSCRFVSKSYYYNNENNVNEVFTDDELSDILFQIEKSVQLQSMYGLMKSKKIDYMLGLVDYYKTQKRTFDCDAGEGRLFISSSGNVYACSQLNTVMGNIKSESLKEILDKNIALRNWIKSEKCSCYTECNIL